MKILDISTLMVGLLCASVLQSSELTPATPSQLLANMEYYEIEDLQKAAALMLSIARINGIDVELAPNYSRPLVESFTEIQLPAMEYEPQYLDHSFANFLSSSTAGEREVEYVAVLVVWRQLTIREVAELLQSGLRIYHRFVAGRLGVQLGGFIVRGDPQALCGLVSKPYYRWMGEYLPAMKQSDEDLGKGNGSCWVYSFYRGVKKEYLEQLREMGIQYFNVSGLMGKITVRAEREEIEQMKKLKWVKTVFEPYGEAVVD